MRPRSRGARGRTTRGAGSDDTRGPSLLASPESIHGRPVLTGNDEQRDSTAAPSAGGPGPLSRLLQELADASGDDALEAWKNELHPGERLGRFEIQREIGRGGFGAVYQAFDTELGRVVAVKTLRLARKRQELSLDWI